MNHLSAALVSEGFFIFKGVGIIFLRHPAFLLHRIFLDSSDTPGSLRGTVPQNSESQNSLRVRMPDENKGFPENRKIFWGIRDV